MYKKLIIGLLFTALLSACSGGNYKIKSETGKIVNTVPKWYMADFDQKKACNLSPWTKKDNDKMCLFGVATAVSPDLQLAIDKGKMIAKAELADIIKGEMNKQSKQFITELGKTHTKTVVSEVEVTLVNIIKNTPVRGYEIFAQDVTLTKNGYYRVWIGLSLPMGEFNKLYSYNIDDAVNAHNIKLKASKAWADLVKESNEDDKITE